MSILMLPQGSLQPLIHVHRLKARRSNHCAAEACWEDWEHEYDKRKYMADMIVSKVYTPIPIFF